MTKPTTFQLDDTRTDGGWTDDAIRQVVETQKANNEEATAALMAWIAFTQTDNR